jgi:26S proteasome regulatory subunit N3
MGEIPDRNIFSNVIFKQALKPYFRIVQSVRSGDLEGFNKVVSQYSALFQKDKNFSLISR